VVCTLHPFLGLLGFSLGVEGCDINNQDGMDTGNPPLVWAAHNGHEEVVKMLLRHDNFNPNKPNNNGGTPPVFPMVRGSGGAPLGGCQEPQTGIVGDSREWWGAAGHGGGQPGMVGDYGGRRQ